MALGGIALSLGLGSLSLSPETVFQALFRVGQNDLAREVIWQLRLPRALGAFACGGLLALSGVLLQALLANPLAEPYLLGISGGASVGALATMVVGLAQPWPQGGAFVGALVSTMLVFTLSRSPEGWTPSRLLLTGVVVAAGWGALVSLLLTMGSDVSLRGMVFWLMGDLSQIDDPRWVGVTLVVGFIAALGLAPQLNILAHGEYLAATVGVEVSRLRLVIYLLASLLTALAVTEAGTIGFVGLVVPHLVRLIVGADHRWLLPGAVLAGGGLLTVADTLARTLVAPQELPVGVITALLGVPLFLWLLYRQVNK